MRQGLPTSLFVLCILHPLSPVPEFLGLWYFFLKCFIFGGRGGEEGDFDFKPPSPRDYDYAAGKVAHCSALDLPRAICCNRVRKIIKGGVDLLF